MRHRWYDVGIQRFVSRDPIGLEGGANLYRYAGNVPNSVMDPVGLEPDPSIAKCGADRVQIVEEAISLMKKAGALSGHPEVQTLGKNFNNLYQNGRVYYQRSLGGDTTTMYTSRKDPRRTGFGKTMFQALDGTAEGRFYTVVLFAALFSHETVHNFYRQTMEREPGKLSPPRVQIEMLRRIRDLYSTDPAKVEIINTVIRESISGAQDDYFDDPKELWKPIICEPGGQ